MKAATAGTVPKDFEPPKNAGDELVTKRICLTSGLLAGPECPGVREEIFKKETAPTKYCNIHTGAGLPASDNGAGNSSAASSNNDILEMGGQAVVKTNAVSTPTPGAASAESAPATVEKKAVGESSYPDEGF
jgi:hypothetical protein